MTRLGALALVAVLAFTGCSASASSHRDPDTLVLLTRTDGATMNPMYAETVQDGSIYEQLLYDSLSYIGADYLPHPRLATSWKYTPDGLHWTVDLRRDVRWSDGVTFTSKDVVFSYRTFLDPKVGYLDIGSIKYIKNVTAHGPYRVRFDLQYPSAVFTLSALGESIVPEHVLGQRWRPTASASRRSANIPSAPGHTCSNGGSTIARSCSFAIPMAGASRRSRVSTSA